MDENTKVPTRHFLLKKLFWCVRYSTVFFQLLSMLMMFRFLAKYIKRYQYA